MSTVSSLVPSHQQRVVGIDPGSSGALGLLTLGAGFEFIDVADMPVRNRGRITTNNVLDAKVFRRIIEAWRPSLAVIEDVQPMPHRGHSEACPACGRDRNGMPPKQAFTFGDMCGSIRTALEVLDIDVVLVQPQKWKRAAGLKRGDKTRSEVKAASLTLARELWPDAPLSLARHEARAEALLLARFGTLSQIRLL